MNRFIVDYDVVSIAQSLCDQHIVKMPLEEAQMLCTALWHHAPDYAEENNLYKPVHQKHPCTIWAMHSRANYIYAYNLYCAMLAEYNHRYDKFHGCGKHIVALAKGGEFLPDLGLTKHPQCFSGHDDLKTDEFFPVNAYRDFYKVDKLSFARYNKGRQMPEWLKKGISYDQEIRCA
tara:strand:- start:267 stop:794 length:528 start_codon:yes stop_codon:yes gene_type:complete